MSGHQHRGNKRPPWQSERVDLARGRVLGAPREWGECRLMKLPLLSIPLSLLRPAWCNTGAHLEQRAHKSAANWASFAFQPPTGILVNVARLAARRDTEADGGGEKEREKQTEREKERSSLSQSHWPLSLSLLGRGEPLTVIYGGKKFLRFRRRGTFWGRRGPHADLRPCFHWHLRWQL